MNYSSAVRKAERKRRWRAEHPEESRRQGSGHARKYREENGLKCRARYEVRKALRNGTLEKKPCLICGELVVEAHHEDYGKPLDVQWLCGVCHDHVHAKRVSILFI